MMLSCRDAPDKPDTEEAIVDTLTAVEHIEERGVLIATTSRPELNYCLLDGRPAGFQFELLDDFSDFLGAKLELRVSDSLPQTPQTLFATGIDLYAGEVDTTSTDSTFHYVFFELPVATASTYAWMIPKHDNDSSLLDAVGLWMQDYRDSDLRRCFYRYFDGKGDARNTEAEMDQICQYDPLIRAEAAKIGWDWRMLASIIYQESHFKPDLINEKGAFGLMQLMPVTMSKYGIDYDSSVEEQLEAAGKLLTHFGRELPETIVDSLERGNFILASYNAGMGHILEARIRAERHGMDPNVWFDNVEKYTSRQTYYFVRDITKRYSHYCALIE